MRLLQSPDPAIKLARQYGIRGFFTPDLVPSLQPVVLIDDLTGGVENTPKRICVVDAAVTGVAAEFSVFRFETPSTIIAHITQIYVLPETDGEIHYHFGSSVAAPAAFVRGAITDGRLRLQGQVPASVLGQDTYAVAPTPIHGRFPGEATQQLAKVNQVDWWLGNTTSFDFLEIWTSLANNNATCSIVWEEFSAQVVK